MWSIPHIVGGLFLGIGAQVFILPYIDSIAGFTFLFLLVTIPAAWIATSGPRLSYFGVQILVAFYLINLSEFQVQTSLEPARDRVIGIFLGLLAMWLAFDLLWSAPAVIQMKKSFISSLRLVAQFARQPVSKDPRVAAQHSYSMRETINSNFARTRAMADAVALEFGSSRQQDLIWRSKIKEWQPQLRALFITRIALWKYRMQLPGFELPAVVVAAQKAFDEESAKLLEQMADRLEGKVQPQTGDLPQSFARLQHTVQTLHLEQPQSPREPQLESLLQLSNRLKDCATLLNEQI